MPQQAKESAWIKWLWQNGYDMRKISSLTGCGYAKVNSVCSGRTGVRLDPLKPEHLFTESVPCKEVGRD